MPIACMRVNLNRELTKLTGLGAVHGSMYIAISRNRGCASPKSKVRIANPQIARKSGTQRPGYGSTRALYATVPSSSGPARKHTAKFEPAAWSWAQMTSGFGAPKRILSEGAFAFKLYRQH